MARPSRTSFFAALSLGAAWLALTLAACTTPIVRPALDDAQLAEQRRVYGSTVSREYLASIRRVAERLRRIDRERKAAGDFQPLYLDILILSGGGDYGAFGAGFLEGWGRVPKDHPLKRPRFDVVTGVSTGALIAPFAFVDDEESYEHVLDHYREPKKDWVRLRGLLFFLPDNPSFLDTRGLERDIERTFDAEMVSRIAAASRDGKRLAIGATNLDYGVTRPFDLGAEAEKAEASGDRSRLHNILLASSAIPAVFPPRIIDDHLYVDGGATANILFNTDLNATGNFVNTWKRESPDTPLPKIRFWVIVNNQLHGPSTVVQPRWGSITGASLSASIRAATLLSLRQLYSHVELLKQKGETEASLHVVSIPADWKPPSDEIFSQKTMQSLTELGIRMGADPSSWQTDVPQVPMQ